MHHLFKKLHYLPVALALAPTAAVGNTKFSIHFNESSTLQLINDISNDHQKLLKYFSGTAIFTPFFVPSASVLVIKLDLYLNEGTLSSLVTFALLVISALLKPHKLPQVYSIKWYIGIAILIKFASLTNVPSISVLQSLNSAQFLNATCVVAVSDHLPHQYSWSSNISGNENICMRIITKT